MDSQKPLSIDFGPIDYLVLSLVSALLIYIPLVGPAILLNFSGGWFADHTKVNGRALKYNSSFGESFKMTIIGTLLTLVTLGIYIFWFVPKLYKYVAAHIDFADGGGVPQQQFAAAPQQFAPPTQAMPEAPQTTTPQFAAPTDPTAPPQQ